MLYLKCVDFLQDVSKILTAVLDVVNVYWRVCLEESYFLLMAENMMARGWSSGTTITASVMSLFTFANTGPRLKSGRS